jgi:hypothetical protein
MGTITPFIPRTDAGGWTAAERDRLAQLAERLEAAFGRVNATYGVSDKGEPWCVITDEDDEVIVHVARIDGQFFIHHAGDDVLRVGDTLWSACERLMGEDWRDEREDVVVSLSRRQAQSVLALAVLADFVYEIADADASPAPEPMTFKAEPMATAILTLALAAPASGAMREEPVAPAPEAEHAQALTAASSEEAAPKLSSLNGDDHLQPVAEDDGGEVQAAASRPAPAPAAPGPEARVQVGGDGNDVLQGGDGRDVLIGGAGDDTAVGGGADDRLIGGQDNDVLLGQDGNDAVYGNGGDDTVDGGEGDDWVRGGQGQDSVAGGAGQDIVSGDRGDDTVSGGEGADTFLFFSGGGLDQVTDFNQTQGDRVLIEGNAPYQVTQQGDDTVIELDAADRVVLVNVQATTLTEGWIVC